MRMDYLLYSSQQIQALEVEEEMARKVKSEDKIAWLMRAIGIEGEIMTLEAAKQKELEKVTGTTAKYSKTPGGGSNPHKFDTYTQFSKEVDKSILELTAIRTEVLQAIRTVELPILRNILISRYINGREWEEIAGAIGYSVRQTHRLHDKAISLVRIRKKQVYGPKKDVMECHIKQ